MTVNGHRALIVKALRNARKQHRTWQTRAEELERTLDRMIERKTIIRPAEMDQIVKRWDAIKSQTGAVERALADAISTSKF